MTHARTPGPGAGETSLQVPRLPDAPAGVRGTATRRRQRRRRGAHPHSSPLCPFCPKAAAWYAASSSHLPWSRT